MKKLIELDKTNTWLAEQAAQKTGMFVDVQYINKILKGDRNPPKIIQAINQILGL